MFDCLAMAMEPWFKLWRRALLRLCFSLRSLSLIRPAIEICLPSDGMVDKPHPDGGFDEKNSSGLYGLEQSRRAVYVLKPKCGEKKGDGCSVNAGKAEDPTAHRNRYSSNGGSSKVSLFTKRGLKGINQDTMLAMEKFASQEDLIFCGVFDGHGRDGHIIARKVRDGLPEKLAWVWNAQQQSAKEMSFSSDSETEGFTQEEGHYFTDVAGDPSIITAWKESFVAAYKLMDRELLIDNRVDCVTSGTTAVSLVKQGNDLIVGNVGDSRAVLGTRSGDDNSLMALQLTVDSKPNEPREAERIKRCKGRVFALRNEPMVHRVWLPRQMVPGLAMTRALGDYCLKNHGVISEPEVTYRRLTKKDEFVVLATDGVWDVLTNEQVVEIVASSVSQKAAAARRVVEIAAHAWKVRHADLRADDCAAVCLFL